MWTCDKCGEESEDDFSVCWSCGAGQDGSAPSEDFRRVDEEGAEMPDAGTKSRFPVTLHLPGGNLRVWVADIGNSTPGPRSIWANVSTWISRSTINQAITDDGQNVIVNWSSIQAVSYSPDAHTQARTSE